VESIRAERRRSRIRVMTRHTASGRIVSVPASVRSERSAYFAAAFALAVLFMGNNLPSALYGPFRIEFGYSALTQTLLYAVPVVAIVLPGTLVFGALSDAVGRRAVVLGGLVTFGIGDALFAVAGSTMVLLAARLAQGLGIALASASAAATLSDSARGVTPDPLRAQRVAALTATICITGGLALGPLIGGIFAQYAPAPLHLVFAIHLALVIVATSATWYLPGRTGISVGRWRPARLHVPVELRRTFAGVAIPGFLCWAVLGVFSALIPSLFVTILDTRNLAVTAGALAVMIGTSAVTQVFARDSPARGTLLVGLATMAVGLALLVVATQRKDAVIAVLAMLCSGIGHGCVFVGELREVTVATPADERGAVMSVVYFINYLGLGVPAIAVGLLSLADGLPRATEIAAAIIAVLCAAMIPFVARRRPDTAQHTGVSSTGENDPIE
jgi:MFS family permease